MSAALALVAALVIVPWQALAPVAALVIVPWQALALAPVAAMQMQTCNWNSFFFCWLDVILICSQKKMRKMGAIA